MRLSLVEMEIAVGTHETERKLLLQCQGIQDENTLAAKTTRRGLNEVGKLIMNSPNTCQNIKTPLRRRIKSK